MDIIGIRKLDKYSKKKNNNQARIPLNSWINATRKAKWQSFEDVRKTFNSADYYKGALVFNIGGNNYRLITEIDYERKNLYIDQIMTHAEYDEDRWKQKYD